MPSEPTMKGDETTWWCPSDSGDKPYVCDLEDRNGKGSCDCPSYRFNSHKKGFTECKHLRRVFRAFAEHKLKEVMKKRGTLNQKEGP